MKFLLLLCTLLIVSCDVNRPELKCIDGQVWMKFKHEQFYANSYTECKEQL